MFNLEDHDLITTQQQLKDIYPFPPAPIYMDSVLSSLEKHTRLFIESASFLVIASSGDEGIKVSPRGGVPGFVHIIDNNWLFLPDGKGNNKIETFKNLLSDNRIGMLFIVNGYDITLRITARAYLTNDKTLLSKYRIGDKVAKIGTLFNIEKAYLHCGKAINRARLWDPESFTQREKFPSVGTMLSGMIEDPQISASDIDDYVDRNR